MIRYSWSGWRLFQSNNRITGWWMASINSRYFACMVSNPLRDPFEYHRGYEFDILDSLLLEDFHDRSSSFLMGGPTEHDLNVAFEPEKTAARESLERFMTIAWLKPSAVPYSTVTVDAELIKDAFGSKYLKDIYPQYSREKTVTPDPSLLISNSK